MPMDDFLKKPLSRLIPHEGLVIDVATWNAAHDYHALSQRLHVMSMHSAGVVTGLEVVAWDPPDNSVVINPGVAVDPEGRVIIVGQPQHFQLQVADAGVHYLVLQYREVAADASHALADGDSQRRFVLEAYRLEERRQLPDEPYVELARVQVSGRGSRITEARDPSNPGPDEIDLRYRMAAGTRKLGRVRIGMVPLEITASNQVLHSAGVMGLVRAINNTTDYQAEFRGSVNLNQEIADCDLLLMAGQQEFTFAEEWLLVLRKFLERGGVLLGESCGGGTAFRESFVQLVEKLGRGLALVERGHPLFTAYHLFAQAPEGAEGPAQLAASDDVVYSSGDYGCLWEGGRPDKPASREAIRSALELGTNLGIYASQRVYNRSVRLSAQ